jgi:23S rRNA pseudouridine1911/1915/1917 synthase
LAQHLDPNREVPPDVDLEELKTWVVHEDDQLLVINKPGWLVCHPSKRGPLSSLVGAARVHTGLATLHLVARLDRETSGVVILAKTKESARKYQMAMEHRRVQKTYLAIMEGELKTPVRVDQPIGKSQSSLVRLKMQVAPSIASQSSVTHFQPLASNNGYTVCQVSPETGRRHQIRVHAEWIGHSIVGDKMYGPDETLFIEFAEHGWTERHAAMLPINRQALHCYRYVFDFEDGAEEFVVPIANDMRNLSQKKMGTDMNDLSADLPTL